ncbi:MAG TPA: hypothetical protein VGM39_04265 [Kofleriaceae bacterium]
MRSSLIAVVLAASSLSIAHADPKPKAPAKTAPKSLVDIKELSVNFDGNPIARMKADGTTESVGDNKPGKDAKFTPGPTFHANGTIDLKGGYKLRLDADGEIYLISPPSAQKLNQRFARIDGNKIRFELDGGLELDGTTIKVISGDHWQALGDVSPKEMGRTAMLMATALYVEMAVLDKPTK